MKVRLATRSARLAKEKEMFEASPAWGLTCTPDKDDDCCLLITMLGPKNSPYEGGCFNIVINVPEKYPFEPPLVKFTTPVYHPNIDKGGRICMDMLKMPPNGTWVPTITLETLLVSLQSLLANPNPDDPLMIDVANEFKIDIDKFNANAKTHTEKFAM